MHIEKVLSLNKSIAESVTSYIDDLFVDESMVSVTTVKDHLNRFGLESKDPERLGFEEAVRVLGLKVNKNYVWSRDGNLLDVPLNRMTRRQAHRLVGNWIGHLPIAGWLRVVCSLVQRLTASEKIGWNEDISDELGKLVSGIREYMTHQWDIG